MRRLWLGLALCALLLAAIGQDASAKQGDPMRMTCASVGMLVGAQRAGISDPRVIGQLDLAVDRNIESMPSAVAKSAREQFKSSLRLTGLRAVCESLAPAVFRRSVAEGTAMQVAFVDDGPCNRFRTDEGLLFLHERSGAATNAERGTVADERAACVTSNHPSMSSSTATTTTPGRYYYDGPCPSGQVPSPVLAPPDCVAAKGA